MYRYCLKDYICFVKNPNTYIREGYLTALQGVGVPGWAKLVPKSIIPAPQSYYIISSQSKNETLRDKDGFEWLCTVVVDVFQINEQGFSNTEALDTLEGKINEIILSEEGIAIPYFINKETRLIGSTDLTFDTSTQTVERRIITIQHWVNNTD